MRSDAPLEESPNLDLFSAAAATGPRLWTVSELNREARRVLENGLGTLWVVGEVGSWKRAASGHCYFVLRDEAAQLRCVMWRSEASRLPLDPEEGMRVRALGRPTLYEARGEFQLVAEALLDEGGEGLWKLAFERMRKKLEEEGLLAPERKRPLPRLPEVVGVVTSVSGAALHDILTVLRRRAPWVRVLVCGARVQGEGAAEEIARAIRRLGVPGLVDVLIVGRGGGSVEDLWAFNEEPVLRALADCPVPTVSAVGHEVDVTLADLVADRRAPTPSAAAEAIAPEREELLLRLHSFSARLRRGLEHSTVLSRRRLAAAADRLFRSGRRLSVPGRRRTDEARRRLLSAMEERIASARRRLVHVGAQMDALSPLATLRRGYAVPLAQDGSVLRRVAEFHIGEFFVLRVVDGRVRCEPTGIEAGGPGRE